MIIDFHYHHADIDGFVEGLLQEMDAAGVDRTSLIGGSPDSYWEYKQCGFRSNDETLAAVRAHPDRLSGCVMVDPRSADATDTMQRFVDGGFRCVKMFPPDGFYPDDERFFPLYERIEKVGVPILFHTGQTNVGYKPSAGRRASSSKYANPMNIDQIARLFPGIPFVMAHMGYPWLVEAWSVAHANRNVYLDIAGSGPWTEAAPVAYLALGGRSFIPIDFTRVIWGSDNCLPQAESIARAQVYLRQMGCSSEERKLVFGGTAAKLLKS